MPVNPTYSVGTIAVSAGSAVVTGADTLWVAEGIESGDILEREGLSVTVQSVESNTQLTLVKGWPGATGSGTYELRYTPDAARVLTNSRAAIAMFEARGQEIETAVANFGGHTRDSAAALLADTSLAYGVSVNDVQAGGYIRTKAEGFAYQVAPSGATDHHLTTAGGVKLYAISGADGFVTFRQLGAVGDGFTNDRAAFVKARGRKVRGAPGATYFIDVNSYLDTISILDNTHWEFTPSTKIEWDYFGAALFHFPPGATGIVIDDAHVVWNGDPKGAFPHTAATLRTAYGSINSGNPNDFCTNFLNVGANDVTLNRPRCSAKFPGPGKSIPNNIRMFPRASLVLGRQFVINAPRMDDYTMGVLGNGVAQVEVNGPITSGRYDEYSEAGFVNNFPPGHLIYFSGWIDAAGTPGIERATVGDIFDTGEYQGTALGAQGSCSVKYRNLTNLTTGRVFSLRPHGVFDGFAIRNSDIGPMYWRSEKGQAADTYSVLEPVRLTPDNGVVGQCENVTFEDITLDVPALNRGAISIHGDSAFPHKNVVVKRMSVTMDVSSLDGSATGTLILLRDCENSGILDLDLNLRGTIATTYPLVNFRGASRGCFVYARNRGPVLLDRAARDMGTAGNILELSNGKAGVLYRNGEHGLIAEGGYAASPALQGSYALPWTAETATAVSQSLQLPSPGVYLVNVAAGRASSEASNTIMSTFLIRWWDLTGTNKFASADKIAPDLGVNATVTALTAAVAQNGVATFTLTMASAGRGVFKVSYSRMGALPVS